MYNRYIRNDNGVYHRIPVDSPDPSPQREEADIRFDPGEAASRSGGDCPGGEHRERRSLLSGLLGKLKLDGVDTGDLLLLVILFLLFKDGEDEELLIALALLLIL